MVRYKINQYGEIIKIKGNDDINRSQSPYSNLFKISRVIIGLLFAIVLFCVGFKRNQPNSSSPTFQYLLGKAVSNQSHIHEKPTGKSPIICYLRKNQKLLLSIYCPHWYRVHDFKTKRVVGYIFVKWVKDVHKK